MPCEFTRFVLDKPLKNRYTAHDTIYSNYANNLIIIEMLVKVDLDMLFTYPKNFFLYVFK